MIRSICARLALPLVLLGAVGCQQPAPNKPSAPATPPAPAASVAPKITPSAPAPAAVTPSASKQVPATSSVPAPAAVTPSPSKQVPTTPSAASALPAGAATTAPVIIGESGSPTTLTPAGADQALIQAEQSIDVSQTSKPLPVKQEVRNYMDSTFPNPSPNQ